MPASPTDALTELLLTMRTLRRECPWDREQTPQSLTRFAIEEAYEVEAAVASGNPEAIRDELGDLLLQVIFQAQLFTEQGLFDFSDIANGLTAKLIRRHPHVFGDKTAASASEVATLWQEVKQAEAQQSPQKRSALSSVKAGPALNQAQDLQKAAARLNFDWPDVAGARDKLSEELAELDQAIASGSPDAISDELGDSLFALVNVARKLGISSESALLGTTRKFRRRFAYIEEQLAAQHLTPEVASLEQMDTLWNAAKVLERETPLQPASLPPSS